MTKIQFNKLQKRWDNKLKKEGFEDVEERKEDRVLLKRWHGPYFQARYKPEVFRAKQEYYRRAGIFLNEYEFQDELSHLAWKLHSEGLSYRDIASKMRTVKNKFNKDKVKKIISSFVKIMFSETKEA